MVFISLWSHDANSRGLTPSIQHHSKNSYTIQVFKISRDYSSDAPSSSTTKFLRLTLDEAIQELQVLYYICMLCTHRILFNSIQCTSRGTFKNFQSGVSHYCVEKRRNKSYTAYVIIIMPALRTRDARSIVKKF